jgi:glycosyltransferase involved in cell wall biosynthesis
LAALEAMAWGVPVISSNSGLSEVNLREFQATWAMLEYRWNGWECIENFKG